MTPYRKYTYYEHKGYLFPDDPNMTERRRSFWLRWQKHHHLPVPNEISGSTGIKRRSFKCWRERVHAQK